MKRAFILYTSADAERNGFLIGKYKAACADRGVALKLLLTDRCPAAEIVLNERETAPFVINRTRDAFLAERLEAAGVRVSNPAAVCRTANDKLLTYRTLSSAAPMLQSFALESADTPPLPYPFVLKPRGGHGGAGVELITDRAGFEEYIRKYGSEGIIAQPSADTPGRDMRVYVVGGRPVFAMLRTSNGDFRSNYCLGGSASPVPLGDIGEELSIVRTVCDILRPDYCGVDVMYHGGGPILNEIEDPVGARMLYTFTDIDPAELHIKHILG